MLYREIIAVCSEIHTKHINTLCGQNVELLNVKPGGTIQINQRIRCNNSSSLLLDVYVQLNMFRASSRPSSGAQQL